MLTFLGKIGAIFTVTISSFFGMFAHSPAPTSTADMAAKTQVTQTVQTPTASKSVPISSGVTTTTHTQPNSSTSHASSVATPSGSVFVTPHGTRTLKFPLNWTTEVITDDSSFTNIFAHNPNDPSDTLTLAINARPSEYTTETYIGVASYGITGNGGHIISTTRTANGFILEGNFQSAGQPIKHIKVIHIATPTMLYLLSGTSPEVDWNTYGPLFDQAAATLQVN